MDIASDSRRLIPPLKVLTLVFDTCISRKDEQSGNQLSHTGYRLYAKTSPSKDFDRSIELSSA